MGGQLIRKGRSYYLYNDAGDLVEKKDHEGKKWIYEYWTNGLLSKVIRPDKNEVTFEYDALGRRVSKTYKGKTTKFLWDGNKVLHEWKEYEDTEVTQSKAKKPQNIVTWLYKDGSFAPIGKITENESYSIVTDHLGTPTEMYNSKGERVCKVIKDIYGRIPHKFGGETQETDCQVRYQGQYEDYETGLYYNRFRYYMPDEGMYCQRDPIGLAGGNPSLYGYVWDSTRQIDVFGLDCVPQSLGDSKGFMSLMDSAEASRYDDYWKDVDARQKFSEWLKRGDADNVVYFGVKNDDFVYTGITKQELSARLYQHNYGPNGKGLQDLMKQYGDLTRNKARAIEQYFIEYGPNALNKIDSIGVNHRFYKYAREWALQYLNIG